MIFRNTCLAIAFCFVSLCSAAESIGIATIVDGEAILVRQTVKHALKPGTTLDDQDLIETGPKAALVRLEFTHGMLVDIGPQTRVILAPKLGYGARSRQAALYVVNGWIKLSTSKDPDAATAVQVLSDSMDISKVTGSAVISVQEQSTQVFSESGGLVITERRQGKPMPFVAIKSGSFFSKNGNGKATIAALPPTTFISGVPTAFLDKIAPLASRFKASRPSPAKPIGDLDYKEALPWLNAERDVRYFLVASWSRHLNQGLRTELANHIQTHKEWDRVLFPEKYMPLKKSPSPPVNK